MVLSSQLREKDINFHLIEFVLPFYHLLSQYKFALVTLGELSLIIIAGILLLRRNGKFSIRFYYKPFIICIGYILFRDILRMFLGSDLEQTQINHMLQYTIDFVVALIVSSQPFNENKLYRYWKFAGILYCAGIFYQVFQVYVLGHSIMPISIIPGYELRPDSISLRPSSFFAEPASFVWGVLPLQVFALEKKDYRIAILTTICLLLSTSTVGVILSALSWALQIINRSIGRVRKFLVLLITVLFVIVFTQMDVFSSSYDKLNIILEGRGTVGSRLVSGFEVNFTQTAETIIFGTNYHEAVQYVRDNLELFSPTGSVMANYRVWGVYLNTISFIIFKYGIIGVYLYLMSFIWFLQRKPKFPVYTYVIMVVVSSFGQSRFLNDAYFESVILVLLFAQIQFGLGESNCYQLKNNHKK